MEFDNEAVIINVYQGVEESRGQKSECKHFEGGTKSECNSLCDMRVSQ